VILPPLVFPGEANGVVLHDHGSVTQKIQTGPWVQTDEF